MFITINKSGYIRDDGTQFTHGLFLVLCQPKDDYKGAKGYNAPIRAFTVFARMRQLGHFMMANVKVAGHELVLSGKFGHDGLTLNVPHELYEAAIDITPELHTAWNADDYHEGIDASSKPFREWALQNLDALRIGPKLIKACIKKTQQTTKEETPCQ